MASVIYTSTLSDFIESKEFLNILQKEVRELRKMYVYTDPWNAAHLIKWEIELPDYSLVREDF